MKKILALVLVLSMVLGSFGFAFAATPAQSNAGQVLKDLGVLKGNVEGDLMLDTVLKRQDIIVLLSRLMGAEQEAEKFPIPTAFTDVTDAYYKPFIGWAQVEGLTNGIGDNKFGFDQELTVKELATMLLRALGHEGAHAWNNAEKLAVELGLVAAGVDFNAKASRAAMAEATINTLKAPIASDAKVSLGDKLGFAGYNIVPAKLEVVSVSATNLKQVEVVFGKEVDRASATNTGNYTVTGQTVSQATLLADGKTVVLTIAGTALQSSKSTVAVTNVQGKDLNEIAPTKLAEITFADVVAPTITEVKAVGNKQVVVTLSEPVVGIQAVDFKLNGKALSFYSSITPAIADGTGTVPANQQYTFTFASALPAGAHELTFDSVVARRDAAGFAIASVTNTLEIVNVTGAPSAVISTATASSTAGVVKVTFDRPMNLTAGDNGSFYLNTQANPATSLTISADKTVVTLTFGSMPVGAHVLEISRTVADAWGNILHSSANPRLTFNAVADVEAPVFESAVSPTDTTLRLRFNEVVDLLSSQNNANYEIKDGNGTKVAPISSRSLTPIRGGAGSFANRQVDITLGSWLPGGTYTITVTGVKDTAGNVMAAQTLSFFVTDLRAPQFKTITNTVHSAVYNATTSRVEVFFNEPMAIDGAYSIVEKANWQFNAAVIPAHVVLYPGANNASVIFQFAATDVIVPGTSTFTINIAKDVAGNIMAGQPTGVATAATVNNPHVVANSVEAKPGTSANDVLTFDVNQDLIGFDFTEFQVNGTTPTNGSVTGRTVTLVLPNGTLTDGTDVTLTLVTPAITRNYDGAPIILQGGVASLTAKDKIAPTLVSAAVTSTNQVTLTFNEPLNSGLGATFKADFLIDNNGATVAPASSSVAGSTVVLQLASGQSFVLGGIVTVYPVATAENTQDLAGNVYAPTSAHKTNGLPATNPGIPAATTYNVDFAAVTTVEVIPATVEYRAVGATTWVVGPGTTLALTPGTNMEFRVRQSGVTPAGAIQTLTVPAIPAAPAFTIDYTAETTVEVIPATVAYSTNAGTTWTNGPGTTLALTPGTDVQFKTLAVAGTSFESAVQTLVVAAAPALGTVTVAGQTAAEAVLLDGVAIVTADGYEYTTDGTTWLALTTGRTFDLTGNALLQVRVAPTATTFASPASADLDTL